MILRVLIVIVVASAVGTSGYMAWLGTGGQSSSVISTRAGSHGVGYVGTGGVK